MTVTARIRLFRFSLVGAIGIGVQLGVLAILIAMAMNYLLATALAVEAAVLHNFLWHQRYTWADRLGDAARPAVAQLLRFHLSNGLISMLGNLVLMRLLAGWLGVRVLLANLATVSLCFVANYLASDRWVFLGERPIAHQQQRALREGKIDQGRGSSQRQAQSDLRRQQKWREGPELIEYKDSGKQAEKFSTETCDVERDSREQIQAHRNANRRGYDQDGGNPGGPTESMLQQFLNHAKPSQRADVETEIQNLNEEKKHPYVALRDRRQVFRTSE